MYKKLFFFHVTSIISDRWHWLADWIFHKRPHTDMVHSLSFSPDNTAVTLGLSVWSVMCFSLENQCFDLNVPVRAELGAQGKSLLNWPQMALYGGRGKWFSELIEHGHVICSELYNHHTARLVSSHCGYKPHAVSENSILHFRFLLDFRGFWQKPVYPLQPCWGNAPNFKVHSKMYLTLG